MMCVPLQMGEGRQPQSKNNAVMMEVILAIILKPLHAFLVGIAHVKPALHMQCRHCNTYKKYNGQ